MVLGVGVVGAAFGGTVVVVDVVLLLFLVSVCFDAVVGVAITVLIN